MLTEFVSLQLSREELREIHTALLQRAMVEDELRRERDQEKVETHVLLDRFETLLGENEMTLHAHEHVVEDELWEHSWYAFTDEWAWFRATQEVERECKGKLIESESSAIQKQIALNYKKNFEMFVREIDMRETTKIKKSVRSQKKLPK